MMHFELFLLIDYEQKWIAGADFSSYFPNVFETTTSNSPANLPASLWKLIEFVGYCGVYNY